MRRFFLATMAVSILFCFSAGGFAAKICIDPGHGGTDSGAVGCGQLEDTNVLNTSLKFRDWMNADTNDGNGGGSWSVYMTRSSDVYVSLSGRTTYANNNAVDRFLSIHNNACGSCGATGIETYSYSSTGTGADLRNKVQYRMLNAWGLTNRGNKTASFYVIRYTNMPAELAELGFIDTCSIDANYVGNGSRQDSAALAHLFAIQTHLGYGAYQPGSQPSTINPPYNFDSNAQGWSSGNSLSSINWTNCCGWPGIVYADQTGNDGFFYSPPTSFTGSANSLIHVRCFPQGGSSPNHDMKVYWTTSASPGWDEAKSSTLVGYTAQDGWFDVYMGLNGNWTNQTITRMRLDVDGNNTGTRWIIDKVEIVGIQQPPYNFDASAQGWSAANGLSSINWTNCCGWPGIVYTDQTGNDGYFYGPMCYFTGSNGQYVHIRVFPQSGSSNVHDMRVLWTTTASPYFGEDKATPLVNYVCQDAWIDIYCQPTANWAGQVITQLRLDVDQNSVGTRWIVDTVEIVGSMPPPAAPTSLAASAASQTQINLTWADNASNEGNYIVGWSTTVGGPYTDIDVLPADTTSYSDTGLNAGTTNYYVVRAINAAGASANSNEAAATTLANPPAAPSGLSASAVSATRINLAWTDNSSNEQNFKVARSTTSGGPYSDIATLGANVTSYSDTTVAGGMTYYYVVRAVNSGGSSANSNQAQATTNLPPPAAPSALGATASGAQVNLAWADNSSNEESFIVARATTSGGSYTDIATLGANTTTYADTSVEENTTYYYVVRAVNGAGTSANSNEASASIGVPDKIVDNATATVNGLWSTGTGATDKYGADYRYRGIGTGANTVVFAPTIATAGSYQVYEWHPQGSNRTQQAPHIINYDGGSDTIMVNQETGGGAWNLIGTFNFAVGVAGNVTISDQIPEPSPEVVMADAIKFVYVGPAVAPTAPSGLAAAAAGESQIDLSWSNALNESGYVIGRSTAAGGPFTDIATAGANTLAHSDTGLAAGTRYWYVVRAVNAAGASANSNEASAGIAGTLTVESVGAEDGNIIETGANTNTGGTISTTNTYMPVGDIWGSAGPERAYRSIMSFNTSALPDGATITAVSLQLTQYNYNGGNPFSTLGSLNVDMGSPLFGAQALESADFQAAAGAASVGTVAQPAAAQTPYTTELNGSANGLVSKTGTTQVRVRFSSNNNGNSANDYVNFYSGNHATQSYRPKLIVQYVP